MSEEIDALIQNIGNALLDCLEREGVKDGEWEKAWMVVGVTQAFCGTFGRYLSPGDPDPCSFDLDFELVVDPVVELHKVMTAQHNSRWTGALFNLHPPGRLKVDFHYPEEGEDDLAWYGVKMRED